MHAVWLLDLVFAYKIGERRDTVHGFTMHFQNAFVLRNIIVELLLRIGNGPYLISLVDVIAEHCQHRTWFRWCGGEHARGFSNQPETRSLQEDCLETTIHIEMWMRYQT